jgi:formylglycine-generating enzyme
MGSQQFYPDEGPVHTEHVKAFAIEEHPLASAQFSDVEPGALIFVPTAGPVDLSDWRQWWRWSTGADWRHPFGPIHHGQWFRSHA